MKKTGGNMNSRFVPEWLHGKENPVNSKHFHKNEFYVDFTSIDGSMENYYGPVEEMPDFLLRKLSAYCSYICHERQDGEHKDVKKSSE